MSRAKKPQGFSICFLPSLRTRLFWTRFQYFRRCFHHSTVATAPFPFDELAIFLADADDLLTVGITDGNLFRRVEGRNRIPAVRDAETFANVLRRKPREAGDEFRADDGFPEKKRGDGVVGVHDFDFR